METLYCLDSESTLLGFLNPSIAPDLLFYAYVPIAIISLLLGFVVLRSYGTFKIPRVLFFSLTIVYTLYLLNEVILWIATPAGMVEFGWAVIAVFYCLLGYLMLYFSYTFARQTDVPFAYKAVAALSFLPVLLLLPTSFNTTAFDLIYCESSIGALWYYIYPLMASMLAVLVLFTIFDYHKYKKGSVVVLNLGIMAMFLILLLTDVLSEYFGVYEINIVGPLGMLLFMMSTTFLIVRYHAFNIKLVGAQALVIGLLALVGSLLFVAKSDTTRIVAGATLIFTAITGFFLVRSVKKEVKQREELEILTSKLAAANDRLKELDKLKSEFVSIASHQMRSPLTSMRGYASMVLDGSYGSIPDKAREAIQRIADSSAFMAKMIENYLNVSRIESGNMKYELSDFNLKLETEKVVDDKRQEAMKKGLLLTFKSNLQGQGIVHADIGKTLEIIHNLLNNALKYTPKGSIDVLVHDDPKKKKIYVDIHDSGIGMNPEDVTKLFGKFERAQNANSVNITGTGLGLYVARTMALAMKGEITAMSEGQGKGSTFRFELPMMM